MIISIILALLGLSLITIGGIGCYHIWLVEYHAQVWHFGVYNAHLTMYNQVGYQIIAVALIVIGALFCIIAIIKVIINWVLN